ncbi:MAG: recombinase family protein [Bacteroides sp.]|nr:recombinase family protein [Bacillota bacterium]MCM1394336.1 recombinase family protein [[Eubacterium] siraeum]MCM1456108.1 recombinase family protein [Bacteroides sp.]
MKYTLIYARYSSERQTEQSIEGQLRECNKFAEQNGLVIVDTYIDRAMTGTNDNRAAFQQMLR